MTNIAMERSTMLLIGKPSISMGHLWSFPMAMLNNQRVVDIVMTFKYMVILSNNEELWLTGIMTMAIYHLFGLIN